MAESIQRGGTWWNQQADGSWLRWDEASSQWQPSGPPPPPTAPPPATAVTSPLPTPGATQPLETEPGWAAPASTTGSPGGITTGPSLSPSRMEVLSASETRGGLMQNRMLLALVAVVLVAALAFAGFTFLSADDAETPVPNLPPGVPPIAQERAEFIAKADAICAQLNAASAALPQAENRKELIARIRKGRAISIAAIRKLRALDYPEADKPVIRQLFALSDRGLALLSKGLRAVERGDRRRFVRATRRSLALGQRFNVLATEYGFTECNQDA